jgi:DNA polymerase-3 subunit delta'
MAPRVRSIEAEVYPESDRTGDLPHPRERFELFGHSEAARTMAEAARSGHLHHAWIIAGPKGVGKATLAWRFARALLAHGAERIPDDLSVEPGHAVARQVSSLSYPDLILLRRPWNFEAKKLRNDLTVDEVRRIHGFFSRHATHGGYRIAIIDAADEMNTAAQNALLKILEEPPARALLLLVSHAPGGLLPTTRSRCRLLQLRKLDPSTMGDAVALLHPGLSVTERELVCALSDGAPGRAAALADLNAVAMYREITDLMSSLPSPGAGRIHAFAEKVARAPSDRGIMLFAALTMQLIERHLRSIEPGLAWVPGEDRVHRAMGSAIGREGWVTLWEDLRFRSLRADELNLDKKQLVLNCFFAIEGAARR